MYLSKASIQIIVNNSDTIIDYILKLYGAVITHDWDSIKSFNGFPKANNKTILTILDLGAEKFDHTQLNMTWMNKGFSQDNTLDDFYIGIPDNLYTLKPLYEEPQNSVEEFFNETDYDEHKKIQKEL